MPISWTRPERRPKKNLIEDDDQNSVSYHHFSIRIKNVYDECEEWWCDESVGTSWLKVYDHRTISSFYFLQYKWGVKGWPLKWQHEKVYWSLRGRERLVIYERGNSVSESWYNGLRSWIIILSTETPTFGSRQWIYHILEPIFFFSQLSYSTILYTSWFVSRTMCHS